jgi:hypothetical protein
LTALPILPDFNIGIPGRMLFPFFVDTASFTQFPHDRTHPELTPQAKLPEDKKLHYLPIYHLWTFMTFMDTHHLYIYGHRIYGHPLFMDTQCSDIVSSYAERLTPRGSHWDAGVLPNARELDSRAYGMH